MGPDEEAAFFHTMAGAAAATPMVAAIAVAMTESFMVQVFGLVVLCESSESRR